MSGKQIPATNGPIRGQLAAASLHSLNCNSTIPVADLRGEAAQKYEKSEITLRNRLASLYRLVDLFEWSQGIYNHITLRLPDSDHLLINPYGLHYYEITASSLVKIDLDGNVIDPGSTEMGISSTGYVLHGAVHRARADVACVIHIHTAVVAAVATMKCGLLPICQEAMIVGPVSYHDYGGILEDVGERQSIADDLGEENKIMLLRNHGAVICGSCVDEAWSLAWHLAVACETQVCAARAGIENLVVPNETVVQKVYQTAWESAGGMPETSPDHKQIQVGLSPKTPCQLTPALGIFQWRAGELEWEGWMRVLDNAQYPFSTIYPNGSNYCQIFMFWVLMLTFGFTIACAVAYIIAFYSHYRYRRWREEQFHKMLNVNKAQYSVELKMTTCGVVLLLLNIALCAVLFQIGREGHITKTTGSGNLYYIVSDALSYHNPVILLLVCPPVRKALRKMLKGSH